MGFDPFEVNAAHLAYAFLGAFVVLFGMCSLFVKEKLYIGEAPIATLVGIIIGPHCLKLFNPYGWGGPNVETTDEITLEVTRVVIAISVFAVGVELPKAYMARHWRSLFFLLGPCMFWGWFVSALLMWGLIPGLELLSALVIAACVTPTDPILAQAVVGGKFADKHVPAHIRHILSAESGSNDGAAFPFLFIAIYLLTDENTGKAIGRWFYTVLAYEILLGTVIGSLLGFVARKVMKFAENKRLIDRQSYVAQYVSLAVMSIGITVLLGSDDLLSAFACGCAFAWDGFFNKATEDAVFSNVIDLLFNCAAFIYIGALIPFGEFNSPDVPVWRLVVLTILILILRRLPIVVALYKFIPDIKTFREAVFTGWFGPMGVGAIFISTLANLSLPEGSTDQIDFLKRIIRPIVAFLVLSSVLTHGLSIPFFSLGRRVHSITYTWSRQPSMDAGRDEPAWTTHARRILPGQDIVINRDDDAEEGDLGVRHKDTPSDDTAAESLHGDVESRGSGSSQGEFIQMHDTHHQHHPHTAQRGEEEEDVEVDARDAAGEEKIDDPTGAGRRTPPLAEYREGNHLVVERRAGSGGEVSVEVIRHYYDHRRPSQSSRFLHPHRLRDRERERLRTWLPKVEEEWEKAKDEGRSAMDKIRQAISLESDTELPHSSHSSPDRGDPAKAPNDPRSSDEERHDIFPELVRPVSPEQMNQDEEPVEAGPSRANRPPVIRVNSGKKGLRRFFGLGHSSPSSHPGKVEEGLAPPSDATPGFLTPPRLTASPRPIGSSDLPTPVGEDGREGVPLSRTISAPRNTSIRFAPDAQGSSDTAPSFGNYGTGAPGFKRNPALAMYRASSVQSTEER